MIRVDVNPAVLTWARERAGLSIDDLAGRFSRLDEWEAGRTRPTLKQLQTFAGVTHTPFGFLLMDEPPVEELGLSDFRTFGDTEVHGASPDLLEQ